MAYLALRLSEVRQDTADGVPAQCRANVARKIEVEGGWALFGIICYPDGRVGPHVLWLSPEREVVEVTPRNGSGSFVMHIPVEGAPVNYVHVAGNSIRPLQQ